MNNPIESTAMLRQELITVLQEEYGGSTRSMIGTYTRPAPLTPVLAIFVGDRELPAGSKMIVSSPTADPILPAMEVNISRPRYTSDGRNFGARQMKEFWDIRLIFHDRRQDPRMAIASILANFQTAEDFTYIPGQTNAPDQYSNSISRIRQILVNA